MPFLDGAIDTLAGWGDVRYEVMGSLRRARDGEPTDVGDLDLLVWCPEPDLLTDLRDLGWPSGVEATQRKASGWVRGPDGDRMMLDAWLCPAASVGPMAVFLTGPARLNVWMRQVTMDRRPEWLLSQYGLFEAEPHPTQVGKRIAGKRIDQPLGPDPTQTVDEAEEEFWMAWAATLGVEIPYVPPSERADVARRYLHAQRLQSEKERVT